MNYQRLPSDIILPTDQHSAILYRPHQSPKPLDRLTDIAVFPGSFNPLHEGHIQLRQVAQQRLGLEVVYELSVSNVEKNQLSPVELSARLAQFKDAAVLVTDAPRFIEKAKIVPRCPFVVGFDTAQRMLDPKYYGDNPQQLLTAMQNLRSQCPRIVVGGRLTQTESSRQFCSEAELQIPDTCKQLFEFIPESEFRIDVSSSELRIGLNRTETE